MTRHPSHAPIASSFSAGTRRFAVCMAAASGVLLLLTACSQKKQGGFPPAPVTVATAATKDVPYNVDAIGTVEPYNTVSVKAQVGGEIARVAFHEGQDVKKGQVLFVVDPRPYRAALQAAKANLDRDKAQLQSAQLQEKRYADLVKKDYVTQQQYDDAVASAGALKATVQADEAAVEQASLNLGYCTVRAPIAGRTGNLLVQLGNVVKANDTSLVVLNQITPIYVTFSVPEKYLSEIRKRQDESPRTVVASSPSGGGSHEGRLSLVNNSVDPTTGTILLKATFPNKDKTLWPGTFVNVTLRLSTSRGAVVVPSKALQRGQQGEYIFVVKPDETVESRSVVTGQELDGDTVIEKGIAAGERVVTDGQLRLYPGAKVNITTKADKADAGEGDS